MIFSLMANHMLSLSAGTALDSMKRDFLVMMKGLRSLPLRVPGTFKHSDCHSYHINSFTSLGLGLFKKIISDYEYFHKL